MKEIGAVGRVSVMPEKVKLQPQSTEGPSFEDRLNAAVKDVNHRQNVSDTASEQVVKGELGVHEGMMRIQEADISLRLLIQVRGKALEAYREVIRMQF